MWAGTLRELGEFGDRHAPRNRYGTARNLSITERRVGSVIRPIAECPAQRYVFPLGLLEQHMMSISKASGVTALFIAGLVSSWVTAPALASSPPPALTSAELSIERQDLEKWKAGRLARLTSETGWLTLTGLYWLKPGDNTFGRAKSNSLVLTNNALPEQAGKFVLKGDKVKFVANKGASITHDGKPVTEIDMIADTAGEPTVLKSGSVAFFVIERVGKLGVRVRDSESPHRKNFSGLEYFPVDDNWVFNARFEPYAEKKHVPIVNILGMEEQMEAPGALVFTKDGKEYRLDAVLENPNDTELFVMFADGTSGKETYGAGRFMYVEMPENGIVRLNFNKAYNPPCAFNEFATCPLPPPQNRITALRVDAGEKTYGHH
jgi:uncharacterized protein